MCGTDDGLGRDLRTIFGRDLPGDEFDRAVLARLHGAPHARRALLDWALAASLLLAAVLPAVMTGGGPVPPSSPPPLRAVLVSRNGADVLVLHDGEGVRTFADLERGLARLDGIVAELRARGVEPVVDLEVGGDVTKSAGLLVRRRLGALGVAEEPKPHHVGNALLFTILDVRFESTPLDEALAFLANAAGVGIRVSPEVGARRPLPERLVSYSGREVSAESALRVILLGQGLDWRVDGTGVEVFLAEAPPGDLVLEVYDVSDLVEEDEDAPRAGKLGPEELMELLAGEVDEAAWDAGAEIGIVEGGALTLKAPARIHGRILRRLGELRSR